MVSLIFLLIHAPSFASASAMAFIYKHDKFPGMEFSLIYATGTFVDHTAGLFQLFVQRHQIKDRAVVIFKSTGGSVAEALSMGRMIRQMGFDTEVSTECFSSCTIAFLRGVRRYVGVEAKFGVHRISSTAPLDSADALDLGQIAIAEIVEYSVFMGVEPSFVSRLTEAGPDEINLLSHDQLLKYKIISNLFTTKWEMKAREGHVYLMSSTNTNNGYHKMIFLCDRKGGIDILMLYNATGEYREDVLTWNAIYQLNIDGKEFPLDGKEIKERVRPSGEEYVSAVIHISPRIYALLVSARVVGFQMLPPSRAIYAGWDSDFATGREEYIEYLRTCR